MFKRGTTNVFVPVICNDVIVNLDRDRGSEHRSELYIAIYKVRAEPMETLTMKDEKRPNREGEKTCLWSRSENFDVLRILKTSK
jgi:hypothetical protein